MVRQMPEASTCKVGSPYPRRSGRNVTERLTGTAGA
jgi:hypothetical protein